MARIKVTGCHRKRDIITWAENEKKTFGNIEKFIVRVKRWTAQQDGLLLVYIPK